MECFNFSNETAVKGLVNNCWTLHRFWTQDSQHLQNLGLATFLIMMFLVFKISFCLLIFLVTHHGAARILGYSSKLVLYENKSGIEMRVTVSSLSLRLEKLLFEWHTLCPLKMWLFLYMSFFFFCNGYRSVGTSVFIDFFRPDYLNYSIVICFILEVLWHNYLPKTRVE